MKHYSAAKGIQRKLLF